MQVKLQTATYLQATTISLLLVPSMCRVLVGLSLSLVNEVGRDDDALIEMDGRLLFLGFEVVRSKYLFLFYYWISHFCSISHFFLDQTFDKQQRISVGMGGN